VGVNQNVILRFAFILNCEVTKTPFKYLGFPVRGFQKRSTFWDDVVDIIKSRLSTWKRDIYLDGWEDLLDQVCSFVYSAVLFYPCSRCLPWL